MATRTRHGPGRAAHAFSPSSFTFWKAVILVSIFLGLYTMITLTGVVECLKYHQLVTYSQSLISSRCHGSFLPDWNVKDKRITNRITPPLPTVSDELSDFHIYNLSRHSTANIAKVGSPRPQLHVLIDARHHVERPINLCRTLLSVVIQGYPPPILVGYGTEIDTEKRDDDGRDEIASSTESFLRQAVDATQYTKSQSAEEQGGMGLDNPDNIVMFLGRDQWVQMPAEVTVRRYLQHKEIFSRRLAREYGDLKSPGLDGYEDAGPEANKRQGYHLGVLFPASRRKTCFEWDGVCNGRYRGNGTNKYDADQSREREGISRDFEQHRDGVLPESSLPWDIYGTFPELEDKKVEHMDHRPAQEHARPRRYQRPRYLGSGSFIGSAADVELLLKGAVERIGWLKHGAKDHNEHLEGEQEAPESIQKDKEVDSLTYLFSEMFFEQEIERRLRKHQAERELGSQISPDMEETTKQKRGRPWWFTNKAGKFSFLDWLKIALGGKNSPSPETAPESDRQHDKKRRRSSNSQNYEFSIGLDYENRIFQSMAEYIDKPNSSLAINITNDIQFLTYSQPNLVKYPSQSASQLFNQPLMLPPEMLHPLSPNGTSSPFGLNNAIYNTFLEKILEAASKVKVVLSEEELSQQTLPVQEKEEGKRLKLLDQDPDTDSTEGDENVEKEEEPRIQEIRTTTKIPWSALEFATNIVVPRGSIPSVLDMSLFTSSFTSDSSEAEEEDSPARKVDSLWQKMWFNQQTHKHPSIPHRNQKQNQQTQAKSEQAKEKAQETEEEVKETIPAKYALLDEYRAPNPFIYALEADAWDHEGGKHNNWWNVRGGRGGFWTDQGAWIPWSNICYDLDV